MAGMKLYGLESSDPERLGPYRLLRRIATGGMGRIYLARQEAPGTRASTAGPTGTAVDHGLVAVKTLLAEGFVSRPDRDRFAREVELAGRVDSAYTATVLDADARAERPWLAIEFIPAPSLTELVLGAGTLPAAGVRWVAAGAARALVELHALGVVHRDIKPLNVLLPHDGPRLIDFGISHAHDHTSSTTTIGTFAFTSPEQASGRRSTAASDLYSLGATLFFLAVGRPPYAQTDHSIGVLALVQRGETDTSGLPPELEPLILPLLDPDPARRPTPADVLRDCRGAGRRLPDEWCSLVEAYASQGRQLADGTLDLAAAEARTQVRAESGHEGVAGREGTGAVDEALTEMREQLEALRVQRDALVQAQAEEQAEAESREQAREEEEERRRRERERKEAAEQREQERKEREREEKARKEREAKEKQREARERKEKERKEKERKERERKERERAERERVAREATRTRTTSSANSSSSATKSTGSGAKAPAKKPASGDSGAGLGVLLVVAAVIGLIAWHPWDKKDEDPDSGPTPSYSQPLTSGGSSDGSSGSSSGGLGDSDSLGDTDTDTDTSSSSSASSSSGGSAPDPETSSPEPDPTEEAFEAVSAGDCLSTYDTGYGGDSSYDWSEDEPSTTSCSGSGTRVRVTGTTGGCPSGGGRATWSHGDVSLCLSGRYEHGSCLLARHEGNSLPSIAMLSSVNCTDRKVPAAYNEIVVVTNIYRASTFNPSDCHHGSYDTNTYWSTKVDGGETVLCVKAYD
ncbi:serine/threonine-protein kinase [Actinomycetota bacterium Odt1-20B]